MGLSCLDCQHASAGVTCTGANCPKRSLLLSLSTGTRFSCVGCLLLWLPPLPGASALPQVFIQSISEGDIAARRRALRASTGITVVLLVIFRDGCMAAPNTFARALQSSLLTVLPAATAYTGARLAGQPRLTSTDDPEIDWIDAPVRPSPPPPPAPGPATTNDTAKDVVQWVGLVVGGVVGAVAGEPMHTPFLFTVLPACQAQHGQSSFSQNNAV